MLMLTACGSEAGQKPADIDSTIATNRVSSGKLLPTASLDSVDGRTVDTTDLVGRSLLINFWYSTCEPCRREMPALNDAYERHGERIGFVGVNMYDSAVAAGNFAERYGVTFEILLDTRGELVTGLGIALAPTTILVDDQGKIVHQESGELTAEEIDSLIVRWFPE
jgi:peroxiredoxin